MSAGQYDPTRIGQVAPVLGGVYTSPQLAQFYRLVPVSSLAYTSDAGMQRFDGVNWIPFATTVAVRLWTKVGNALRYSDFTTSTAINSIVLFSLDPGAVIQGIKIKHSASFAGGGISAYTISVGNVATPDLYASAYDVFQAPGSAVYQLSNAWGGEDHVSPTAIYATATSTGANLNAAAVGTVDIWALLSVAAV